MGQNYAQAISKWRLLQLLPSQTCCMISPVQFLNKLSTFVVVVVAISFSKMSKSACDTIMQVFESGFIDKDSNYSLELEALKTTCRQKHIQKL